MQAKISDFARGQLEKLNVRGYKNLAEVFERSVAEHADQPAFVCSGMTTSFAQIDHSSRSLAAWLLGPGGLRPGDRIAIQLPNITQYPIAAWGALRAGLTIVNTNPMYTGRELLHQYNDSGAKALVVLADLLPLTETVVPQTDIELVVATHVADLIKPLTLPDSSLGRLTSLTDAVNEGEGYDLAKSSCTMDDIAVLQYTSGTTGVAKGAILTQGNLFASFRMGDETFAADPSTVDIAIAPMPLYHIYGFAVNVVSGILKGSLSVLIPNARDTDDLIRTMQQHPFTVFTGINTLFVSLMQHAEFDNVDFSHLSKVISGGTPLVEEIATEWQDRTGTVIYEGYGLSESAAGGALNTPDHRQLGSVGKSLAYSEIRVVDENGRELGNDQRGELQLRGPHVTVGYWQRPEETAETLDVDGWFSTGDVAVIQQDGFIRIVDRIKDMIIVSGFNVYPTEIENVVYGLQDVVECAAIGVPYEKTGQAVKLFIVSKNPELSDDDVRDYCREQLTAYKVPKFIEFRDELPKSIVGKILRRELRDCAGA